MKQTAKQKKIFKSIKSIHVNLNCDSLSFVFLCRFLARCCYSNKGKIVSIDSKQFNLHILTKNVIKHGNINTNFEYQRNL